MKCFSCGKSAFQRKIVTLTGERNGESFTVTTEGMECPKCGFATVDNEQSAMLTVRISDAYKAKHGLLTSSQIREYRRILGMSQQQFADYLHIGVASVKRWELGMIQDAAMDELIRLKVDIHSAVRNTEDLKSRLGLNSGHSQVIEWGSIEPRLKSSGYSYKTPASATAKKGEQSAYCYRA